MSKEIKLNDREIEILKAFKTLGYNWLARDNNEELYAFTIKPKREIALWFSRSDKHCFLIEHGKVLFNFIKWRDKEPTNIDGLLKGE